VISEDERNREVRGLRPRLRSWIQGTLGARRPAAGIVILALVALGSWLVSISSARDPIPAASKASPAHALVPGNGERLGYGTGVKGTCLTVNHAVSNDMRGWGVYTFDPGRAPAIGGARRELLPSTFAGFPTPPGLDAFASNSTRPPDLSQWQLAGGGRQMPVSPAASCVNSIAAASPDAIASGTAVVLRRPGPYVYWTFDHSVHWVKVDDATPDPTAHPCARDSDQAERSPAPVGSPPAGGGHGWHWAVDSFCTSVRWWSFYVLGSPGRCSLPTDTSLWPGSDYINQYAAGRRLELPVARGRPGGNACGPASLLMAMLQSKLRAARDPRGAAGRPASLPALQRVFDQTMRLRRARVTPNGVNDFVGLKATNVLRKRGWVTATLGRLGSDESSISNQTSGSDLDPSNQTVIDRAVDRGPVVISTDFGTGRWGTTGDGHMIVVMGRAPSNPDEYVVFDPAGNYFSDPANHYGSRSCGSAVLYPRAWLLAYTTGAWYIALGAPPRGLFRSGVR
jgi:hypothetical protein